MPSPYAILLVDDEPEVLKALERTLRSVGKVYLARSGEDALAILEKETIHVILSDQRMPGMTGIELLAEVAKRSPHTVRVILTGFTDLKDMIEAINRAGIYRYLTKPWDNEELRYVIRHAIDRYRLQEENLKLLLNLKDRNKILASKEKELLTVNRDLEKKISERTREIRKANNQLHKLAVTDPLTKLGNRRYFLQQFEEEVKRFDRYQRPLSILMMDIDYFKQYNDIGGHLKGDDALRKIAQILKQNTRKVDTVARYGGEEFVLLLPETDKEGALEIAERLRRAIEKTEFPFERKLPCHKLTLSIGLATTPNDCGSEGLIKKADEALYQAKKRGRNCVVLAK